jgi:hypothetical protein
MDQYTLLLTIGLTLLVGIIGTLKLLPYFTNQVLNQNQILILLQAKKYAQEIIIDLKLQFGDDYIEQKETIIELISVRFPSLDKKIVEMIVDYLIKGLDYIVANYNVE